jgi:hypothetical protein
MTFITELSVSLTLCLLCTIFAWGTRPLKTWFFAIAFGIFLALDILGIVFSANLYPWTALLVLMVSMSAGVWLGRALSIKRLWPFLLLLVILSVLDTAQIVLTHLSAASQAQSTHSTSIPAGNLYINFLLFLPGGQYYTLGIFDLWLMTAMAEYWRRRQAPFWIALSPAVLALVPVYSLITLFPILDPIALIPFLTASWLCSIALYRSYGKGLSDRQSINKVA